MPASKRLLLAAESDRLITALRLRLAGELRASRSRRRWTQVQLGRRIGCSQSAISDMERAEPSVSIELWHRAFAACGRRLTIDVSRDPSAETLDAPHLAMQELVLRLARNAGISGTFELRVPGATGRHSIDVCLRDDRLRLLVLAECWNRIDDVGRAARSFSWKLAKAEELAIAIGHGRPHAVHGVWIVRATRANRELVRRYPHAFTTRFPGPSTGWVRALTAGGPPPGEPGLVWCDIRATRLFAVRAARSAAGDTQPA